jgi:hypothetical protein
MLIRKRLLNSLLEQGGIEFQETLTWNGSEWAAGKTFGEVLRTPHGRGASQDN